MTAAVKFTTHDDLRSLPENRVGEIIGGLLRTQPRPRPNHGAWSDADASRVPTFDPIELPLSNLWAD